MVYDAQVVAAFGRDVASYLARVVATKITRVSGWLPSTYVVPRAEMPFIPDPDAVPDLPTGF
jgi:hypothetical protein